MTKKHITLEEALKLVDFQQAPDGHWFVKDVLGTVEGDVEGSVKRSVWGSVGGDVMGPVGGDVGGTIGGNVFGNVGGDVTGHVHGNVGETINGYSWKYVESPRQKVERLIKETGYAELLEAFNQMEDN